MFMERLHRTRTAASVLMAHPGPLARDCGCRSRSDEAGAIQMGTNKGKAQLSLWVSLFTHS